MTKKMKKLREIVGFFYRWEQFGMLNVLIESSRSVQYNFVSRFPRGFPHFSLIFQRPLR